jgi:hypothetical protein
MAYEMAITLRTSLSYSVRQIIAQDVIYFLRIVLNTSLFFLLGS